MSLVGTNLPYYIESGAGDCVVLMLHGIGGSHGAFARQMQPLAQAGYRAVAWDMPGYGYSRSVLPYTFDSLAESCSDLIDVIDARRVVLLGHSMGGMVAQRVIATHPEKIDGLVLVATSAAFGGAEGTWQREFIAQRLAPLEAGVTMAELARILVRAMVGSAADAGAEAAAAELMAGVSPATYRHALHALVDFDARASLAGIAVPTLLVAGSEDHTAPVAVMQKMSERITAARLVVLEGVGHIVPIEAADAFNGSVLSFLARHFPLQRAPGSAT